MFLFNKIFREVIDDNELMFDSMTIEIGSTSDLNGNNMTSSSSAVFEKNNKNRKLGDLKVNIPKIINQIDDKRIKREEKIIY
jgi:hypothetical protein